jgi:hypothetical protein
VRERRAAHSEYALLRGRHSGKKCTAALRYRGIEREHPLFAVRL